MRFNLKDKFIKQNEKLLEKDVLKKSVLNFVSFVVHFSFMKM